MWLFAILLLSLTGFRAVLLGPAQPQPSFLFCSLCQPSHGTLLPFSHLDLLGGEFSFYFLLTSLTKSPLSFALHFLQSHLSTWFCSSLLISPIVTSRVECAICFWGWAEVWERGRVSMSGLACQQTRYSCRANQGETTSQRPQGRQRKARPSAPLSSLSHPRGFLAGVGEVGIESLSPDSFPDLVGCYPVISQTSLQKPLQHNSIIPENRRSRHTTCELPAHLRIPTTNKSAFIMALYTTQVTRL